MLPYIAAPWILWVCYDHSHQITISPGATGNPPAVLRPHLGHYETSNHPDRRSTSLGAERPGDNNHMSTHTHRYIYTVYIYIYIYIHTFIYTQYIYIYILIWQIHTKQQISYNICNEIYIYITLYNYMS